MKKSVEEQISMQKPRKRIAKNNVRLRIKLAINF